MESVSGSIISPAQITLRGVGVSVTLLCAFLALAIYSDIAILQLLLIASPFFMTLWLLWLLISRPIVLALSYFAAHSVALAFIGKWVLATTDPTERWIRILPLIFIDMPVGGPGPLFVLPTPIACFYLFVVGGAVWAWFGWWSARGRSREEPNYSREPNLFGPPENGQPRS